MADLVRELSALLLQKAEEATLWQVRTEMLAHDVHDLRAEVSHLRAQLPGGNSERLERPVAPWMRRLLDGVGR